MSDIEQPNEQQNSQPQSGPSDGAPKRKRRRSRGFRRERPDGAAAHGVASAGEMASNSDELDPVQLGSGQERSDRDHFVHMSPEQERKHQLNYAKIIGEPVIKGSGLPSNDNDAERKAQQEFGRMMMAQAGEISGGRGPKKHRGPR